MRITSLRPLLAGLAASTLAAALPVQPAAAVAYNEFADGDLPATSATAPMLPLAPGANILTATSSGLDFDVVRLVVPAGSILDGVIVEFHDDPNKVFLGIQSGADWTAGDGNELEPSAMLGYTEFPPNLDVHIGEDLIDELAYSAGAIGFSPPLGSGTYSLFFRAPSSVVPWALSFTVTSAAGIPGDFNGDQFVTGSDLAIWRSAFGITAAADANGDGTSDGADLLVWQRRLAAPAVASAPEPGGLLAGLFAMLLSRRSIRAGIAASRAVSRRGGRSRRGMSLVEILIVVAVIAALIALLLPATMSAREAARRRVCGNNLKQIGLALHEHIAAQGRLPAGYKSELKPNGDDAGPGWAWGAELLPYLEQQPLFEQIDRSQPVEAAEMTAVRLTSLPTWICPSDGEFQAVLDVRYSKYFKPVCQIAAASYVGSTGTVRPTCILCRDQFDGVFGRNRRIKPADLEDGASNTLAAGERAWRWAGATMWGVVAGSKLYDHQHPDYFAAGPAHVLGTTFRDGFNICDEQFADTHSSQTYAESFGSVHPGGAHFAFCDGGVRFVFEDVDPGVMNALATRDGVAKGGLLADPVIHVSPF